MLLMLAPDIFSGKVKHACPSRHMEETWKPEEMMEKAGVAG